MNKKQIIRELQNTPCGNWENQKGQKVEHLFKVSLSPEYNQDEYKLIEIALEKAYYSALKDLLKAVEKGKLGELDYEWNGKKVIKDNIIFKRKELIDFFRYKYYGKPNPKKLK